MPYDSLSLIGDQHARAARSACSSSSLIDPNEDRVDVAATTLDQCGQVCLVPDAAGDGQPIERSGCAGGLDHQVEALVGTRRAMAVMPVLGAALGATGSTPGGMTTERRHFASTKSSNIAARRCS